MRLLNSFLVALLSAVLIPREAYGYNVLLLSPYCSKSHKNSIDPAITELVARGHRVTEVSMEVNKNSTGIRQYELSKTRQLAHEAMDSADYSPFAPPEKQQSMLTLMYYALQEFSRYILADPTFQRFQSDTKDEKFDVIIVNAVFNDIAMLVAHEYNAPIIQWCPASLIPHIAWTFNIPYPLSYVTSPFQHFQSPLTFLDRLFNTLFNAAMIFGRQYILVPAIEKIYEEFSQKPHRSVLDIEKNSSLLLVNTNIVLEKARPIMPNVINVGAMHCRPAKKLPKDLDQIASGSNGFIVFSLGSIVKGTQMPQPLVDIFFKAFGKMKEKVIWKFEGKANNIPTNVIFKDWIPQQDLIGHPNCKLAILHGGLNGLQEAVYHGVPVLGMPLGADRDSNLAIAVNNGFAEIFDWVNATEEALSQKLDQLLHTPKYKETAMRLSAILRDSPQTPAATAAYWIEYVARHKGAYHLKSNAGNVNLFQYFLLDVFAAIIALFILTLVIILFAVKFVYRLLFRSTVVKTSKFKQN